MTIQDTYLTALDRFGEIARDVEADRGLVDRARAVRMAETTESSRTGERGSIRRTVPNGMTAGSAHGGLAL